MQLMEQQEFREMKEREKENRLRQIAYTTGTSITEARATQQSPQQNTTNFQTPQQSSPRYQSPQQTLPQSSQGYGLMLRKQTANS